MKKILLKIVEVIKDIALGIWNYQPFAATRGYIWGKWVSILLFALMVAHYKSLPEMPFIELYYTTISVFGVALLGPLLRLILFAEAALYAENGGLTSDLKNRSSVSVRLKHYWFATAISYLMPLICFATISK
jgi:hypothetical protein